MSDENQSDSIVQDRILVKRPSKYKVLIHNDDYTTMEFVIYVLESIFGKSTAEAQKIMLKVHKEGHGVCGVYTFEIAEAKQCQVVEAASSEGHPLRCSIEVE